MTVACAGLKHIGQSFKGKKEIVQCVYDFSADGGATGVFQMAKFDQALIVLNAYAVVKTACTSGGSATVKVGVTGSDAALFGTTTGAVANLTANAFIKPDITEGTPNTVAIPRAVAANDYLLLTIGTAALTAGKIEVTLEVIKP